jgi:hypothetical protein
VRFAGYWILDTGYWILDARCWMLDAGCVGLKSSKGSISLIS